MLVLGDIRGCHDMIRLVAQHSAKPGTPDASCDNALFITAGKFHSAKLDVKFFVDTLSTRQ